ncbi:2'-5' RNA ligase family protein [Nocardia sp. BMG51109]|uniref:2'-5' RNA ligase family protein n=1 Tax=Nocardia sp. BMG51109 TaxID=1056816 RepID=UPI0004653413|nr:2'-5' RNA ligase family protein [Nocardia sp. BMG51109]
MRKLRNHWARPLGTLGYYWFLTFEKSPALHSLAAECQALIDYPYFDPTPPEGLHLTLDRIGAGDEITSDQIGSIETSARKACESFSPFEIGTGRSSGLGSAVAFDVLPAEPIHDLRDTLRSAALAGYPELSLREPKPYPPHITIAYANSDEIPTADSVTAVDEINRTARKAHITIDEVLLVILERRERSYAWQVFSRISLSGDPEP